MCFKKYFLVMLMLYTILEFSNASDSIELTEEQEARLKRVINIDAATYVYGFIFNLYSKCTDGDNNEQRDPEFVKNKLQTFIEQERDLLQTLFLDDNAPFRETAVLITQELAPRILNYLEDLSNRDDITPEDIVSILHLPALQEIFVRNEPLSFATWQGLRKWRKKVSEAIIPVIADIFENVNIDNALFVVEQVAYSYLHIQKRIRSYQENIDYGWDNDMALLLLLEDISKEIGWFCRNIGEEITPAMEQVFIPLLKSFTNIDEQVINRFGQSLARVITKWNSDRISYGAESISGILDLVSSMVSFVKRTNDSEIFIPYPGFVLCGQVKDILLKTVNMMQLIGEWFQDTVVEDLDQICEFISYIPDGHGEIMRAMFLQMRDEYLNIFNVFGGDLGNIRWSDVEDLANDIGDFFVDFDVEKLYMNMQRLDRRIEASGEGIARLVQDRDNVFQFLDPVGIGDNIISFHDKFALAYETHKDRIILFFQKYQEAKEIFERNLS